jgi:hypothetical protein
MTLRSAFIVAGCLSLPFTSGLSWAADPENRAVQLTEQSLDVRATLDYVNVPLNKVLKEQADIYGVKFDIAKAKPGDKAVDLDTLVTCYLKGMSLRSALRIALDWCDLDFVVRTDGVISVVPATAELKAKHVESKVQKAAHAKLGEQLRETTTIGFNGARLKDVVAFLSDQHDCTICFSGNALKNPAINESITGTFEKLPIHEVLRRTLLPLGLQATVQEEVVLIVPWEKAADAKPSPEVAKALEKKFDTDLTQPLSVIAQHFTEQTGIPFLLHTPALKAATVNLDRVVIVKAQGATAAETLMRLKPAVPLKLIERDGLVLITAAKDM